MRLNGQMITNRAKFKENFTLEEFLKSNGGQEKIAQLCVWFEEFKPLSEKESVLIENLDKLNQWKMTQESEDSLAEIYEVIKGKLDKVRAKAVEYEPVFASDGIDVKVLKALILLELAQKDGSELDFFKFTFVTSTDAEGESLPYEKNAVIDLSKILGGVRLQRYGFDKIVSKSNPLVMKTFINASDKGNYEILKVEERDGRTASFIVYGGESLKGIFADGKLVALIPDIDIGERYIIYKDGNGYYRKDSRAKSDDFQYNVENVSAFCATNDGAIFVSGDEINVFSNDQIHFDYSLEDGEKILMICEREELYGILTNYGRLITNAYGEKTNVCYATMHEDCTWYALLGDGRVESCGQIVDTVETITNFETFNFEDKACAQHDTSDEFCKNLSFFGETDAYTVKRCSGEFEINLKQKV